MKFTIDTVFKTITIEGDCTADEIKSLMKQYNGYKLSQPLIQLPTQPIQLIPMHPYNPFPITPFPVTCGTYVDAISNGLSAIN